MSLLVDAVPADMGSGLYYSADLTTMEEILFAFFLTDFCHVLVVMESVVGHQFHIDLLIITLNLYSSSGFGCNFHSHF